MVENPNQEHKLPETIDISITEFRNNSADFTNQTLYSGTRLRLFRNGKPVAALVSMEDYQKILKIREREAQIAKYLHDPIETPGDIIS
jgi:prevent-host-death family protein